MEYEDFVIQFGIDGPGATVRVARSPAGETASEPLSLTLHEEEIRGISVAFSRMAEEARHLHLLPDSPVAEQSLTALGDQLFRSLFPETVRDRYQRSLGQVLERGKAIRLRLDLSLGTLASIRIHAIPWEFLYRSDDHHFLALSQETSIVRHLAIGLPGDRPPVPSPLSILVVAGEDLEHSEQLALDCEKRELEQAWSEPGDVRITVLRECTVEALRAELLQCDYHVLHFMGHGRLDPVTGAGQLAFHIGDGRRLWVGGTELAEQLRDRILLRLVFLNACQTAQVGAVAPYAGVATALLAAGIPAVVAMQFPISDRAAQAFSGAFYRRIARGDTVDSAVTEGRLAIRRLGTARAEWGTPVLFERLTTGRIVIPGSAEAPTADDGPETSIGAASPESFKMSPAVPNGVDVFLSHNSRDEAQVDTAPGTPRSLRKMALWLLLPALGLTLTVWLSVRLPAKPALYEIRVQVLDPQGRPVTGSTIRASAGNEPHLLPDGWWEVQVPGAKTPADGRISLWAQHQDWAENRQDLRLETDPNPQVEIRLRQPETWIRGRVVDRRDRPLAGVRITRQGGATGGAVTDTDGRFALRLTMPQDIRIRLRSEYKNWKPGDDFCYTGRDSCPILLEEQ